MADQKITQLTADTSPSSTDLLKTVKDPAGTPLDRKVTLLDMLKGAFLGLLTADNDVPARIGGALTRVPVAASRIMGRKASGDYTALTGSETFALLKIASASTTLTNTTPNSTSSVQWGTEEAVVAQADAPASAVVLAWITGELIRSGGGQVGDRGVIQMQVSYDGGSTWASIGQNAAPPVLSSSDATMASTVSVAGRSTGTVTGSVQVRAMINDVTTANDVTFGRGHILMVVHPQ